MANITAFVQDTAADADALAGSDLEFAPGPGTLEVYVASTVNTATLTAVIGDRNVVRAQVIPLRANGIPNSEEDPPAIAEIVEGGEKIVINIGGTTGTVHTSAVFIPEEDIE